VDVGVELCLVVRQLPGTGLEQFDPIMAPESLMVHPRQCHGQVGSRVN
jgi:hypothetical protein